MVAAAAWTGHIKGRLVGTVIRMDEPDGWIDDHLELVDSSPTTRNNDKTCSMNRLLD